MKSGETNHGHLTAQLIAASGVTRTERYIFI